jgi:hypothetical protein
MPQLPREDVQEVQMAMGDAYASMGKLGQAVETYAKVIGRDVLRTSSYVHYRHFQMLRYRLLCFGMCVCVHCC